MYGRQTRRSARYAQRGAAARRIQTSYRRYRSAQVSSQRALGNVVRSYRRCNPMQIQPTNNQIHTFWRTVSYTLSFNQRTGYVLGLFSGRNLNFGFTLGGIQLYLNGIFQTTVAMPSFSDWQSLYDYYQINAVKMQVFYSNNVSDGAGAQAGFLTSMPLMHIANDFDDCQENMTLDLMLQRVGVRTVQFGSTNTNGAGIVHYVKPKPTNVVVQSNVSSGVLTTANAGVPMATPWLDCAQSNIIHYGVKTYLNQQDISDDLVIGTITFIFNLEFKFKGYR